jgi:3-oxoacyl-[acyl-carrier protein] reductase
MKTVLITGASRGIGRAIAEKFASEGGWNLVLTCSSSPDALEALYAEIRSGGTDCFISAGDISDEACVARLFSDVKKTFGGLDVLINNAGIDLFSVLQDTSLDEWNRVMSVNLTGPFLTCRAAVPLMLENKSGSILNISSVFGKTGGACESAYSASKGGLNAFTAALAKELAPSGIRVNALVLGAIDTEMNARLSPEERDSLEEEIPLGRMGTPQEAAELAFDIAVHATYMTGGLVPLDGGWS